MRKMRRSFGDITDATIHPVRDDSRIARFKETTLG